LDITIFFRIFVKSYKPKHPYPAVYQGETNLSCVWSKLSNYSPLAKRSSSEMVLGAIPTFGTKCVC